MRSDDVAALTKHFFLCEAAPSKGAVSRSTQKSDAGRPSQETPCKGVLSTTIAVFVATLLLNSYVGLYFARLRNSRIAASSSPLDFRAAAAERPTNL